MTLTTNLDGITAGLLFGATLISTFLTGSTLQWTLHKGFFQKKLFAKNNQYNLLVVLASISSLIETLLAFWNNLTAPNFQFWILCWVVINWIVMTNTSILLVSQRLSLTFRQSQIAWKRLLIINYLWLPCSIAIATAWVVKWSGSITSETASARFDNVMKIVQPVQIATLGIIEFCLSGAFIVQMWKFKWGPVERHSILMLVFVGCCDLSTIFMNLFIGDLQSIVVKGMVYSLRIRLEVNVLCVMVDYLKSNRVGRVSFGTTTTATDSKNNDDDEEEKRKRRSRSSSSWLSLLMSKTKRKGSLLLPQHQQQQCGKLSETEAGGNNTTTTRLMDSSSAYCCNDQQQPHQPSSSSAMMFSSDNEMTSNININNSDRDNNKSINHEQENNDCYNTEEV